MGRGKKDSSAAGGSVDPVEEKEAAAVAVMEVEAFEERQQPRSYGKRKRKRKRKISITPVVSPNPSSHGRRGRPRRSDPRSLSQRPAPERKILPPRASSDNSNRNLVAGSDASVNVAAQQRLGQGDISVNVAAQQRLGQGDISVNVAAQQRLGQGATQEGSSNVFWIGLPSVVVHQQDEHQPASDSSVEGPPPQVGQVNDAKKRITKIIKPVRYFATMTDDGHQVSIMTFRALTSDGQTVLVDDKELKSTNPLLLINYYEQRLHYRTTS